MAKKPKRPTDTNQKAKSIVNIATGETKDIITPDEAKSIAAQLGRLGGLKGGKARAKALSDEEKIKIAKMGAAARWGHTKSIKKGKK
jgi:hypothetical protein